MILKYVVEIKSLLSLDLNTVKYALKCPDRIQLQVN